MFRRVLGFALTGSLAVSGLTSAGDDAVKLGRYAAPTAGFAGGVTTAAPAQPSGTPATADTQLIFGRRTTYVGVPVYPSYYYPSVYYSAPAYYSPFYYGYYPTWYGYGYPYYSTSFYYPTYSYGYGFGSYYYGGYWPINGTAATLNTPTVSLVASPRPTITPIPLPAPQPIPALAPTHNTFRYDGGPSNPIPQPTPESNAPDRIPPASTEPATLRIGLTPPAPKYPAYGDRK